MVINCTTQELSELLDKVFAGLREEPNKANVLR